MTTERGPSSLMDLWALGAQTFAKQAELLWKIPGLAASADPIQALWQGAMKEYEADLSGLPPSAFEVDLRPLGEAWRRVAMGIADEREQRMVKRFTDAMAVKARLGAEYYADPERTPVRPTPRERVLHEGAVELYRYDTGLEPPSGPPVLIVYSVINRSYILDLQEGCSFVRHLLDQGLDVWMIEWTGKAGSGTHLEDYVDGVGVCVDAIRAARGCESVALFGHCIGGTLAAMYASLHPERVCRLLALTAPFRSPQEGVVATITDPKMFDVDAVVDGFGHMPAKLIRYTFMALKPYYELLKWKMFVESLDRDDAMSRFVVVDKWANDNVDIPAGVFRSFIREVFESGRLAAAQTQLKGQRVDLGAITCPVLNVVGEVDWIVPPDSARPLDEQAPDARFVAMPGSHLSLILDPRLHDRWTVLSDFLRGDGAA